MYYYCYNLCYTSGNERNKTAYYVICQVYIDVRNDERFGKLGEIKNNNKNRF